MTPYLIIDQSMITALTFAAKRGVDVKLILPHIPPPFMLMARKTSFYFPMQLPIKQAGQ